VLLGDGSLRADLESLIAALDLDRNVRLPGFRQYDELPAYYGLADAFVHASTTEQWGLVVNEAMASGLPVLVSNRCGCVPELVDQGTTGHSFDPNDEAALARCMVEIVREEGRRREMGEKSAARIRGWGPDRFAQGLQAAAEAARRAGPPRRRVINNLVPQILLARGA
jgi:glycosyltransferase involved in cell wall biosynthesis